jgi:hypothetical protein
VSDRLPVQTSIRRPREGDLLERDQGLLWQLSFTKRYDEKSASTNVEMLSQGELITLWQQIGVLFNLAGMRDELTEEEIEKMGVHRGR